MRALWIASFAFVFPSSALAQEPAPSSQPADVVAPSAPDEAAAEEEPGEAAPAPEERSTEAPAESPSAGAASEAASSEGTAAPPPSDDGPVLDLEGLEEDPAGTPTPAAPAEGEREGGDRFEGRTDPLKDLTERAAAIVQSTTLGGYGEHELHWGANELSKFVNHRYVLFVYSKITDRISAATEIEFEFAGSPLKKDGSLGHGEVLLEFAVVDFELFEWLVYRAGVILVPFGAFNLRHDSPTRDLTERPIAYTTIVPTTWFESGMGLHGEVPLPLDMRLGYELYVVNGLDARIYDGFGMRAARGSHLEDNNLDKALVGRLSFSPTLGTELGLSGYTGEYDLRGRRVNMLNLDATTRWGPFEALGEVVGASIDPGYVEGFSASSAANTRDAVPTGMWGFYAQANYHIRLEPLWALFPDWLQESVFTAVVRYEGKDTDLGRFSAQGDQRRLTFGLNFRPVEPYVIKNDFQINSRGIDDKTGAPELWDPRFWDPAGFRFVTSVAFLF